MNAFRARPLTALALCMFTGCSPESVSPPNAEALAEATRWFEEPTRLWELEHDELSLGPSGRYFESPLPERARGLVLTVPVAPNEPIRIRSRDGWSIDVWDDARQGRAEAVGRTVVVPRSGGSSFWSARDGSAEEWLYFPDGVQRREVARYRIRGGDVRQHGSSLDIYDDAGKARITVAAPAAYALSGQRLDARLEVRGDEAFVMLSEVVDGPLLVDPVFVPAGDMTTDRMHHLAVPLPSGRIFVVGGRSQSGGSALPLSSTDIFDPLTATWMSGPMAASSREGASATTLDDGRVLVVDDLPVGASTEIFDEVLSGWTTPTQPTKPRFNHTATKLVDGRVLVAGGFPPIGKDAEVYEPIEDTWTPTGPTPIERAGALSVLLDSGEVLVFGSSATSEVPFSDAYSPATNSWTTRAAPEYSHQRTTPVRASDGQVVVTSGGPAYVEVESYNYIDDTWAPLPPTQLGRAFSPCVFLPDGRLMTFADDDLGGLTQLFGTTEIFDPETQSWSSGPPLSGKRTIVTANLLKDGRVLVAGGYDLNNSLSVSDLLSIDGAPGTPCAHSSECASLHCADGVCCDGACVDDCMACSIAAGGTQDGICSPSTGEPCDDADLCTQGDVCQSGTCVASPVNCPSTECAAGSCDPDAGCTTTDLPDGTECFSGHCLDGSCIGLASGVGGGGDPSGTVGAGGGGGRAETATTGGSGQGGSGASGAGGGSTGTSAGNPSDPTLRPGGGACGVAPGGSFGSPAYGFLFAVGLGTWWRRRRQPPSGEEHAESRCPN